MADASPNSTKDLEIVEVVDDSKEMGNGENGKEAGEETKDEEVALSVPDESSSARPSSSQTADDYPEVPKSDTSATDSRSIRSRVFVGHLNTDEASRNDLVKLFSECGKVVAISLLNGYGFVQFDNEESARKSIDTIHGTPFFGMKLVVDKPAAWKKLDGENPKDPKPWPKEPRRPFVPDHSSNHRRSHRRYEHRREPRYRDYYRYDDYYDEEIPPRYHDPYYERYLEMRYMEERLADRYRAAEVERFYDRYPSSAAVPSRYPDYRHDYRQDYRERGSHYGNPHGYESRYERPRDDDYDRRRPFDNYYH